MRSVGTLAFLTMFVAACGSNVVVEEQVYGQGGPGRGGSGGMVSSSSGGGTNIGGHGGGTNIGGHGGTGGGGMGGGGMGGDGGGAGSSSSSGGGSVSFTTIFVNGEHALYEVDPEAQWIVAEVPLTGCDDSIVDIAMTNHGRMLGMSFTDLYLIDRETGDCTEHAHGEYPNSLTFMGDIGEYGVLTGYRESAYQQINWITGDSTPLGALGSGYLSSGDVVVFDDGRAYLTVRGPGCDDCLAEVNPTTGAMISVVGPLGHSFVYGLARIGEQLYGFNAGGLVLRIDKDTAKAEVLPLMNGYPGLSFWGAANSTR